MDIKEFHEVASKRAKKLASELGATFNEVDVDLLKKRTDKEIKVMTNYIANKEKYDKFVDYVFENYTRDELIFLIGHFKNT